MLFVNIFSVLTSPNKTFRYNALALLSAAFLVQSTLNFSHANGLNELQQALAKLKGTSEISGELALSMKETRGEPDDEDYEVTIGEIATHIRYAANGLNIRYSTEVMEGIAQDVKLNADDEEANTPTLKGLNELRTRKITATLSQAHILERRLKGATLVSESPIDYKGKPAKELLFELDMASIIRDKRTRDYVDNFQSDYRIIIDQQGVPLSATLTYNGKGRAYIVLSLQASGKQTDEYQVVGDRLVNIHAYEMSHYDSTFGVGSSEATTTFSINTSVNE